MKIVPFSFVVLILTTWHIVADGTNHDWELVRTVSNSLGFKGKPIVMDYVLVPEAKIRDITNYEAAAEAIAGTNGNCMIYFWADRSQIPTSEWIPVTNLQAQTASYERFPDYKPPYLHLACWLYPNKEAAMRANAFVMPGVKMPESETITNKTSDVITKPHQ